MKPKNHTCRDNNYFLIFNPLDERTNCYDSIKKKGLAKIYIL